MLPGIEDEGRGDLSAIDFKQTVACECVSRATEDLNRPFMSSGKFAADLRVYRFVVAEHKCRRGDDGLNRGLAVAVAGEQARLFAENRRDDQERQQGQL